jgi:hypothetical protein
MVVTLVRQGLKDTTGTNGAYSIVKPGGAVLPATVPYVNKATLDKGILELTLSNPFPLKIETCTNNILNFLIFIFTKGSQLYLILTLLLGILIYSTDSLFVYASRLYYASIH